MEELTWAFSEGSASTDIFPGSREFNLSCPYSHAIHALATVLFSRVNELLRHVTWDLNKSLINSGHCVLGECFRFFSGLEPPWNRMAMDDNLCAVLFLTFFEWDLYLTWLMMPAQGILEFVIRFMYSWFAKHCFVRADAIVCCFSCLAYLHGGIETWYLQS